MTTKTKQLEITEVAKTEEVKTFSKLPYDRFKDAKERILESKTFAQAQKKYYALVKESIVDRYNKKSFTLGQLGYLSILIHKKYKLAG